MFRAVCRGGSRARLLVLGDSPLSSVEVSESGELFDLGAERQLLADQACQRMREQGQTVTADPIYRLRRWEVGERFVLRVDRGDYSQVVGTKSHPEWGVKAQVLAACCALECPEGFVIEQRSARVAAAPGLWHIAPSGSLQPPNTVLQTVLCEAEEELGLGQGELSELRCLGLLYGEDTGVYQLACSARTSVPFSDIQARVRSGAWEQEGLMLAPCDADDLPRWISEAALLTPGARAVLLAEGRRRWGIDWFESHCEDER